MAEKGWISLHRKLLKSDIFKNEKMLKVWIYCLLKATHEDYKQLVGLQVVELKAGEFIFGRKAASLELGIKESTLWKHIKVLERIGSLTVKSNNKFSVIKIENYTQYQGMTSEKEQQNNNKITTKEQQSNTNNNINNINNINKDIVFSKYPIEEVISYLNEKANKSYKSSTKKNQDVIKARFNEGFTLEDFKKVINNKVATWKNDSKMDQYLRPQTLFGSKFESYLNEKQITSGTKVNNSLAATDDRMTEEERRQFEYKLTQKQIPF